MSEKTFEMLKKVHRILMIVMIILCAVSTVVFIMNTGGEAFQNMKPYIKSAHVGMQIAHILALACGLAYLSNNYSKRAAQQYRAFMLLSAAAAFFSVIVVHDSSAKIPAICLMTVKLISLIVLTFVQNLGKQKSWILFSVIFVADILFTFLAGSITLSAIISEFARLLIDGTIGLMIMGKYHDKAERGTV